MKHLFNIIAVTSLLAAYAINMSAQIDAQPCDPEANQAVRQLYDYLRQEVWGKRVISGCQAEWNYNTNDAQRIYEACGRYPKINVFDFQHFDQPWINYRTDTAKRWHDAGGIVGFMWHIHMVCNVDRGRPSAQTNFYSGGKNPCRISPLRCVTEGTLENRIFKEKLDGVASLLLYYQEQGIPILWRPLHEAAGGWFWWANDGAEGFKRLWHYMFDYFTAKGIHNLLWIWTSVLNDPDWYPGDDCVDLVANDAYPQGNTSHISNAANFQYLRTTYPTKMACLAECNSVPSWENMQRDQSPWLFVAPWCGGGAFDHGNNAAFWKQLMDNPHTITR